MTSTELPPNLFTEPLEDELYQLKSHLKGYRPSIPCNLNPQQFLRYGSTSSISSSSSVSSQADARSMGLKTQLHHPDKRVPNFADNQSFTLHQRLHNDDNRSMSWNNRRQSEISPSVGRISPFGSLHDENASFFNKYADLSAMTTSIDNAIQPSLTEKIYTKNTNNNNNIQQSFAFSDSPMLNGSDSNSFSNTHPSAQFSVRISSDFSDDFDEFYSSQTDDETMNYEKDEKFSKDWPLQDKNFVLNATDTKTIFNNEFPQDEDIDISDDDDDDDKNANNGSDNDENTYVNHSCSYMDNSTLQLVVSDRSLTPQQQKREPLQITVDTNQELKTSTEMIDKVNYPTKHSKSKGKQKKPVVLPNSKFENDIYTCMMLDLITDAPCSAQFSRSYDLVRHQNTIHAKQKIVFHCLQCIKLFGERGFSKTFSRLDALSRHLKSKHEGLTLEEKKEVTKYAKKNIGYIMAQ